MADLVADLLSGDHRALARVITKIENRSPGYRDLVAELHRHGGNADVIGVTGPPGAGKSTLVDEVVREYRERDCTVGVIAIDPSSPFTGGAVLGDRIRMASTAGDMDVFFRSMSARGSLGGLSTATTDAVTALDAFGKDKVIVETVGAGQNEIDVVRTADTVAVLVPPGSGDDVQRLKAGILEIADVFAVNKADLDGADRTVKDLQAMLAERIGQGGAERSGPGERDGEPGDDAGWTPPILETVATTGKGVDEFLEAIEDHLASLEASGGREAALRSRYAAAIRTLLRAEVNDLVSDEIERRGGIDEAVDRVLARESDPYSEAAEVVEPLENCLAERRDG